MLGKHRAGRLVYTNHYSAVTNNAKAVCNVLTSLAFCEIFVNKKRD